jgi:hypothetical protein
MRDGDSDAGELKQHSVNYALGPCDHEPSIQALTK